MKALVFFILSIVSLKAQSISITAFGAVADGTTDNYYAFKQAAIYAAANPNTTITFPAGTFYIAKYRSVKNDTTDHIKWNNCVGLKLIGTTGTIISMNGTFSRLLNYITPTSCANKSYTTGLMPFYMFHCRNLEIQNIEVNGNVQNTTRPAGVDVNNPWVTEGSSTGIFLEKCDTVLINNMYLHHMESDGITVSGDLVASVWVNSTMVRITNTRSWHNGRQGMSIGGLDSGYIYKSSFSFTGFTGGTYGHNDPAAGVDIEPGEFHYVRRVKFDSCYFEGNYGSAFIVSYPTTTESVTLLKCVIKNDSIGKPQGITMLAKYSLVDSCNFSLYDRDFKITNSAKPGATIGIRNSTITSTGTWINSSSANMADSVVISGNTISFLPNTMTAAFIMLSTSNLRFLTNTVNISPAAIASKPTGSHVFIQNAIISSGNVFSSGTRVDYTGTTTVADP